MHSKVRRSSGAMMPFVTFALIAIVAFLGISIDVMRTALTVRQLKFAVDAAALHAYSYITDANGNYAQAAAAANIATALSEPNGASGVPWNEACAGPINQTSPQRTAVTFDQSDITLIPNPSDDQEFFLRLTGRRTGTDALRMLFLPALYAANVMMGQAVPAGVDVAEPVFTCEVIGQPASRIGAGVPKDLASSSRVTDLKGFATLPLAISNRQFQQAAQSSETRTLYSVGMVNSANVSQPNAVGQFKGVFVNVSGNSSGYGSGQGSLAIDQLIGLLKYFWLASEPTAISPYVVERGSAVNAFDPNDPVYITRKPQIVAALSQVPTGRSYIVPVVSDDPKFGGTPNQIVGFARLKLVRTTEIINGTTEISPLFEIGESVPMRNTAGGGGFSTTFPLIGNLMPAPTFPFTERAFNPDNNSLSQRPRGVVFASVRSPRTVAQ